MCKKRRPMELKMIVMDMDGTLLKHDQTIGEVTMSQLANVQANGSLLVLASGRHPIVLHRNGVQLGMHEHKGYYIGVNGGEIRRSDTMEILRKVTLSIDEIREIIAFAQSSKVEAMVVGDASILDFIPPELMELKRKYRDEKGLAHDVPLTAGTFGLVVDQRRNYSSIRFEEDVAKISDVANKICFAQSAEMLHEFHKRLLAKFGSRFSIALTSSSWLELTPKQADKGIALRYVMNIEGISKHEVMVFGDGENDLPLFRESQNSVAMGNAMESVKNAAVYIADSNENDGIGNFLKKIGV
ncbi:MAG: HAD family phosphatase [Erysipelotrichales bacterium]|nr:MAG: HAD family phosphatase [Erysipelotrichales bacterium]